MFNYFLFNNIIVFNINLSCDNILSLKVGYLYLYPYSVSSSKILSLSYIIYIIKKPLLFIYSILSLNDQKGNKFYIYFIKNYKTKWQNKKRSLNLVR
jgi:hypothetical protein